MKSRRGFSAWLNAPGLFGLAPLGPRIDRMPEGFLDVEAMLGDLGRIVHAHRRVRVWRAFLGQQEIVYVAIYFFSRIEAAEAGDVCQKRHDQRGAAIDVLFVFPQDGRAQLPVQPAVDFREKIIDVRRNYAHLIFPVIVIFAGIDVHPERMPQYLLADLLAPLDIFQVIFLLGYSHAGDSFCLVIFIKVDVNCSDYGNDLKLTNLVLCFVIKPVG